MFPTLYLEAPRLYRAYTKHIPTPYQLYVNYGGGPVGLETLAASLGEDVGTLEDVCEPYLMQNGFLNRTPRGRVATQLAYEHLGIAREEE